VGLPIFDSEHADCEACELRDRRDDEKCVPARPPTGTWADGGLMVIGQGPGRREVLQGLPFVGRAGQLLNALLEAAELTRDDVHVSTATLCQPPISSGEAKAFHLRHPTAVPACLPRLEAELQRYRPRVVVTMGPAALLSATGYSTKRKVQVDNPCDECDAQRKVGPAIACSGKECDWHHVFEDAPSHEAAKPMKAELMEQLEGACPKCSKSLKRLKVRDIKCPTCGGRKKKTGAVIEWTQDYSIKEAAGALFDAADLASRWDRFGVKYIIPTFHPSFLLHPVDSSSTRKVLGGQFAASATTDHLTKARKLLARDHNFRFRVTLTDNPQDIYDYAKEAGVYSWDVETNAKSAWDVTDLRCVGIGRADRELVLVVDTRGMVVNVGDEDVHRFEVKKPKLAEALRWFLTSPKHGKVAQNGAYDGIVVHRMLDVVVDPIAGDTKNAHHVVRPDEPHDLQMMAFESTEAPHWKPPKKIGGVLKFGGLRDLAIYNARDVRATALTHEALAGHSLDWLMPQDGGQRPVRSMPTDVEVVRWSVGGRMDLEKLRDVYDVDTAIIPLAFEMERTGIPINTTKLHEVIEEVRPKHERLGRELEERSGLTGFNPNSPKQLQYVLFDQQGPLKLTATAKTATGQASTAKDELAKLADHPFVKLLLEWRIYDKALGTYIYGKGMVPREDGRIHPSWNTTGARTGRWSSSPNFQNWPEWLREIVEAPKGWQIVGADYSQLELRIVAALSGDPELIRRCMTADEGDKTNPERDPHSFVASLVFGDAFLAADKVGRKVLRGIVKACIYGMNYGAGPSKVREAIYKQGYVGPPIGVQQVKEVIARIFEIFPNVKSWREEILEISKRDAQVRSALLHRWRTFPFGDVDATVAWNFPIQSTGADIINLRLIALKQRLVRMQSRSQLMAQVHDAVYMLVPDEEVEAIVPAMQEELHASLVLVPGAPAMEFPATPKVGRNWKMVS